MISGWAGAVGVSVGVSDGVSVKVGLSVKVAVARGVFVGASVGVWVGEAVGVGVAEGVGLAVGVGVGVLLGMSLGVGLGKTARVGSSATDCGGVHPTNTRMMTITTRDSRKFIIAKSLASDYNADMHLILSGFVIKRTRLHKLVSIWRRWPSRAAGERLARLSLLALLSAIVSACQPAELPRMDALPTRAALVIPLTQTHPAPTQTPSPPTPSPPPSATPTEPIPPTQTPLLTATPLPPTPVILTARPSVTIAPPTAIPPTRIALPDAFVFGRSAAGRELMGYREGRGETLILLVGGIHAGFEANTITLVEALHAHFEQTPSAIFPEVSLIFIPSLNPDGATYGRQLRGRFNGNGVDLNRNWGCDWSPTAVFRDQPVDPGAEPFSEPETQALGSLIQHVRPAAVVFYHAAANGIYGGDCAGHPGPSASGPLARVLSEATGYPLGEGFGAYAVTGSAADWIDVLGIPAADVELATSTEPEFRRNLNGVIELQKWLVQTSP